MTPLRALICFLLVWCASSALRAQSDSPPTFKKILSCTDGSFFVLLDDQEDIKIAKLDAAGSQVWFKTFGGKNADVGFDMVESTKGEIYVLGTTDSYEGDVSDRDLTHIKKDAWLLCLDTAGTVLAQRTFGGSLEDEGQYLFLDKEGELVMIGATRSKDGDLRDMPYKGDGASADVWVCGIDSTLKITWQNRFTTGGTHFLNDVKQVRKGGFFLTGETTAPIEKLLQPTITGIGGNIWVARIDAQGKVIGQELFGGSDHDAGQALFTLKNGKCWLLTITQSRDGDVPAFDRANSAAWLMKLDRSGKPIKGKSAIIPTEIGFEGFWWDQKARSAVVVETKEPEAVGQPLEYDVYYWSPKRKTVTRNDFVTSMVTTDPLFREQILREWILPNGRLGVLLEIIRP